MKSMSEGYNSNYRLTYDVRNHQIDIAGIINNTSLENHICITNGIVIMT